MKQEFTIEALGPFSLERLAMFGFGHRHQATFDGVMRMAFCVDGYTEQVGVEVRQVGQAVSVVMHGEADTEVVKAQVARVLSLDYDGNEFLEVGKRDEVIGRLQELAPGLRPPMFYSPYEAACWSIISARRPAMQMGVVREKLALEYGKTFELAGETLAALPTPEQMMQLEAFPGLYGDKVERLHGVAEAAMDGTLDVETIQAQDPAEAMLALQDIKGIGPFYSALIVIRGSGLADVLPGDEPKSLELMKQLYGLDRIPGETELERMSEPWKPFRTWATVLIRAVGPKLLAE